jgi:DNA replication initiation complex subunit (GINS family)
MAFADEINYEKISTINKKERKSAKLVTLDPGFYNVLIEHLKKLQGEYNTRFLESPTSTEALLLNNEICKLDNMIKEIYTRRERKIILAALDTNSTPNLRKMLDHEQDLYKSITQILNEYRTGVLEQKPLPACATLPTSESNIEHVQTTQIASELTAQPSIEQAKTNSDDAPEYEHHEEPEILVEDKQELEFEPESDQDPEPEGELKEKPDQELEQTLESELEREPEPEQEQEQSQDRSDVEEQEEGEENILVHVLEEIEPFVGTDLVTYNLQKEELATIPKTVAELLMRNNKVRIVEANL